MASTLTFGLVLVLLVISLTSCSPATDEPAAPDSSAALEPATLSARIPERGGTLRTESNWMPYVADPATDGIGTGQVGLLIAEALVWVGEDGVPQPNLVKSWEGREADYLAPGEGILPALERYGDRITIKTYYTRD
jgi:ABC-type transport system substrate-binding protein